MHPIILLFSLVFLPSFASAWGSLGHRTVAYLASMYFSTPATIMTNHLLNGQDISEAALFPDKVRHMPQFAWSAAWHYIDARDDPPRYCGINMTRDCGQDESGGCVVTAIANHTLRVANDSLSCFDRGQSLRFMMHFFGDVHQPLHTEAEARGGNDYAVLFEGKATNLHSVWDTLIPNKLSLEANGGVSRCGRASNRDSDNRRDNANDNINDDNNGDSANIVQNDDEMLAAWSWALRLYNDNDNKEDECLNLDDPTQCALQWATEANAYVCSYVLAKDVHGQDLAVSKYYYDGAVTVVNDMVGKAGRRLAVWINFIAASASNPTSSSESKSGSDSGSGSGSSPPTDEIESLFLLQAQE
ncbi:Nuclease PA3 [Exophiala dermatitidis]